MDTRAAGMLVVAAGVVLVLLGVLIAVGAFGWFGRLPGDLRFGNASVRVYVPLASMLLVSLVVSLLLGLLRR
jgi:hypothetical protein